ncbi:DUF7507 domain-containing protein [Anaerotardibacter muris]|uniref:DUF7507 domain-containing protein n=1 Tax=Anaerotardibacter muris TaxID=2941505 RepID=UPI0020414D44|nr:hypothetical protein [Anaerotardibacter muris]
MKALANRSELMKRALACLVSFTLAFTLFGTPAYAATMADETSVQPSEEAVSAGNSSTAVDSLESQLSTAVDGNAVAEDVAAASSEEDAVVTSETDATDPEAGEGSGSEGTEGEDELEEGTQEGDTEEAPFTLEANAAYYTEGVITYTIKLVNSTDETFDNITLSSSIIIEGISYQLDLPQGFSLEAGQTMVIPATIEVDPYIAYGDEPYVTHLVTASCGSLEAYGTGSVLITPPNSSAADVNVDVNIQAVLFDETGTYRPDVDFALPGYEVVFTFEVINNGYEPLTDVHANPVSSMTIEGDWETPRELQPGESTTYTARYTVTEADDPAGDEYGAVTGTIEVIAGGMGEIFSDSPYKVAKPTYGYKINYFDAEGNLLGVHEEHFIYGPVVNISSEITNEFLPEEGYAPAEALYGLVLSEDPNENVFEVHYQVKLTDLEYMVRFYKGSVAAENLLGTEVGIGDAGDTYVFDAEFLNQYLPEEGYQALEAEQYLTISANPTENTLLVVYEPQQLSYQLSFYAETEEGRDFIASYAETASYGSVVSFDTVFLNSYLPQVGYEALTEGITMDIQANPEQNRMDIVFKRAQIECSISYWRDNDLYASNASGTYTFTATYGSTITIDEGLLNRAFPGEGYVRFTNEDARTMVVTADPSQNTMKVIYERGYFNYTVNYYKDSVSEENFIDSFTGSGRFGYAVYNIDANLFLPEGYQPIDQSLYISNITADPSRNVLNVVYTKRSDIAYTVNYYRDSVDPANFLGSDSSTGALDQEIPYELGKYLPNGYAAEAQILGARTITVDPAANVLNVVYTNRAEYGYIVNYYVDSIDGANYLGTTQGRAAYGSPIAYVEGAFVPAGYNASDVNVSGATFVGTDETQNILNVVYTTKTQLTYTVNYYADEVGGTLLNSVTGYGTLGDAIPYTEGAYQPAGYVFGQVTGASTIGLTPEESVLNVVYTKGTFGYTVNYYKGSVSEENLLGTDAGTATYLSATPYTDGAYLPEGYVAPGVLSGTTTIGYDEAANVLNVVYQPGRFAYTVNYYKGSIDEENLIATTEGTRPYGTMLQIAPSELNSQLPEGYSPFGQAVSLEISADPASNVVNIVFTPDFEAFYAAGIDPLNATYTGAKHYVAPRGVVDGDIITYKYGNEVQTRVVGVDANIGAEFTEVTNGDVPVVVTVTRAGITSDPLQTIVNIAEAPAAPVNPAPSDTPNTPEMPDQPGNVVADQPQEPEEGTQAPGNVLEGLASLLNPALAVPAPSYTVPDSAVDTADEAPVAEETTILDDVNPLASSPFSTTNNLQHSSSGPIGYLLLIIASLFAAAAVALLLMRKRMVDRYDELKGTTLAIEQYKAKHIMAYVAGSAVLSVTFYALWVLLQI